MLHMEGVGRKPSVRLAGHLYLGLNADMLGALNVFQAREGISNTAARVALFRFLTAEGLLPERSETPSLKEK
jgi:hypothetical protein